MIKTLSSKDMQDLKSRKFLTDILHEQIDSNEDLKNENDTLMFQQRKLLLLLSDKDNQLNQFKIRTDVANSMQDYMNERSLKFRILEYIMNNYKSKLLIYSMNLLKQESEIVLVAHLNLRNMMLMYHRKVKSQCIEFFKCLNVLMKDGFEKSKFDSRKNIKQGIFRLHIIYRHRISIFKLYSFIKLKSYTTINKLSLKSNPAVAKLIIILDTLYLKRKFITFHRINYRPLMVIKAQFLKLKKASKTFLALQILFSVLKKLCSLKFAKGFNRIKSHGQIKKIFLLKLILIHGNFQTLKSKEATSFYKFKSVLLEGKIKIHKESSKYNKLVLKLSNLMTKSSFTILKLPITIRLHLNKISDIVLKRIRTVFKSLLFQWPSNFHIKLTSFKAPNKKSLNKNLFNNNVLNPFKILKPKIHKIKRLEPEYIQSIPACLKNKFNSLRNMFFEQQAAYSNQTKTFITMMNSKLLNFHKMNEKLLNESQASNERIIDLEQKLNAKTKNEVFMKEKVELLSQENEKAFDNKTRTINNLKNELQAAGKLSN